METFIDKEESNIWVVDDVDVDDIIDIDNKPTQSSDIKPDVPPEEIRVTSGIIIDPSVEGVITYGIGRPNFQIIAKGPEYMTDVLISAGYLPRSGPLYDAWIANPWQFLQQN